MSTWSEGAVRGTVLRGGAAAVARPARMDSELRSTPYAAGHVVDARLTDPHLQDVVDRARATAVASGHTEGFAEGYAAGLAAAAAEAEAVAERQEAERLAQQQRTADRVEQGLAVLATATRAFEGLERTAVADVEDVVADLALQVARAVLDREVRTSADPGGEAIARALALAPEGCPAVLRLHPDDAAAVTDLAGLAAGRDVVVVADAGVARGGCLAEGAGRHIDAQVETALQRVAAVLR